MFNKIYRITKEFYFLKLEALLILHLTPLLEGISELVLGQGPATWNSKHLGEFHMNKESWTLPHVVLIKKCSQDHELGTIGQESMGMHNCALVSKTGLACDHAQAEWMTGLSGVIEANHHPVWWSWSPDVAWGSLPSPPIGWAQWGESWPCPGFDSGITYKVSVLVESGIAILGFSWKGDWDTGQVRGHMGYTSVSRSRMEGQVCCRVTQIPH